MLPPLDPAVLSSNPKFNALYSDLCNNKLNADGTSKLDAKAQRDRDVLSEDLRKARVETAKRDLVRSGLQELSYRPDELPSDLQQLVAVIAALLEGQVAEEDRYLLHDDLRKFEDNIEQICTALHGQYRQDAATLVSMLDPDNPPAVKDLPSRITQLKRSISTAETQLFNRRISLAEEAAKTHDRYRQLTDRSIHILEQVIHGSVSRGAKARADYLALVAEGMEKKLSVQHAQLASQLFTPEVQEALELRLKDLQAETGTVKRKIREAEERLEEYRMGGGMERLAGEYASILGEKEKVKTDLARLREVK